MMAAVRWVYGRLAADCSLAAELEEEEQQKRLGVAGIIPEHEVKTQEEEEAESSRTEDGVEEERSGA